MNKKQLEEIASRYEAMVHDESQDEKLVPVKARVKKPVGVVYSTRYSSDEIALIRLAAERQGMAPTAFIRAAALSAAAGELDLSSAEKVEALQEAQAQARDLAATLQRL